MAEFVGEQLFALIKEPAGFVAETSSDDKQGKKVRVKIIGAASEQQAIGRVDEETGDPVGLEAIEFFSEFLGFPKEVFGDTVLLVNSDVFDGCAAIGSQSLIEFPVFLIQEAHSGCEFGSVFVVCAKDAFCIEFGQGGQVALLSQKYQVFRNLHWQNTGEDLTTKRHEKTRRNSLLKVDEFSLSAGEGADLLVSAIFEQLFGLREESGDVFFLVGIGIDQDRDAELTGPLQSRFSRVAF